MKIFFPFRVHFRVLNPTYTKVNGVDHKTYSDVGHIFAGIKTFGGTETTENNVRVVKDTAVVHTWYNSICNPSTMLVDDAGGVWSIITPPEDIDASRRFLSFKIERLHGGV